MVICERMKTPCFKRETEESVWHLMRADRTNNSRNRGDEQGEHRWTFNKRQQK
jgi:hypothetical protein